MILFKQWCLDGSLTPIDMPALIEYNGTNLYAGGGVPWEPKNSLPSSWIDLVNDPLGGGSPCLKFTVKATDAPSYGGARTEISPGIAVPSAVELADWPGMASKERWYRWQWMIPEEFDYAKPNPAGGWFPCLAQVHEKSDTSPADEVGGPSFWVLLERDGFYRVYNNRTAPADATQTVISTNYVARLLTAWPVVKGRWVDFVLRAKWGWTAVNALTEIWVDRRKVFSEVGPVSQPNAFRNETARGGGKQYPKFGFYDKWHEQYGAVMGDRVVYHRGLIVADEASAFAELFPESPYVVERAPRSGRSFGSGSNPVKGIAR